MSSPLRLGVRMSWRPVTATERTGSAGIPMIGTIPFRRTGRGAPCGPRPPGPLTCAGRAVRRHRLKDNRSAERRHRRICWPDETRRRGWPAPGRPWWRRAPPGWTHMMINPTGRARHPAPVRGARSLAGTRRRQRPDSPDPSTDSDGGARWRGAEEPVCKLSRSTAIQPCG